MKYFRATYPPGIKYSPGWHGTRDADFEATVLLYNDAEGYCIGRVEDKVTLTPDVTELTEKDALLLVGSKDSKMDGIWKSDKLAHRWDAKIMSTPSSLVDGPGAAVLDPMRRALLRVDAIGYCKTCGKVRSARTFLQHGLVTGIKGTLIVTCKCHVCGEKLKMKVLPEVTHGE